MTTLGAYAIGWATLVSGIAAVVLNWIAAGWRPSLVIDFAIARRLIRYGRHVAGGSLVVFIVTNLDNVIVARTNGVEALGVYALVYGLANLPATHVADVLGRVLFPAFVSLAHEPQRLRSVYLRSMRMTALLAFPLTAWLGAAAPTFTPVVMGQRWEAGIGVFQGLVVFVALRAVSGPTGSLLLASGGSRYILLTGITGMGLQFGALLFALVVLPGGITAAAWAVSGASALNALYICRTVQRYIPFQWSELIEAGGRPGRRAGRDGRRRHRGELPASHIMGLFSCPRRCGRNCLCLTGEARGARWVARTANTAHTTGRRCTVTMSTQFELMRQCPLGIPLRS